MSIKRNEGEDFEVYRERRMKANYETKKALEPKLFHDSYYNGTYENPERREYKLCNTKHGRKQQDKGI